MPWLRSDPDEPPPRHRPDRSWSTRLAWSVLVLGAAAIGVRASIATIVQVHGDGMAPSILDGDHVLVVRGRWTVERGDVVVYDPHPPIPVPGVTERLSPGHPDGRPDAGEFTDVTHQPRADLRNTAVVDVTELENRWQDVQKRSDPITRAAGPTTVLRVGRILAVPGDRLTFHAAQAAMGLAVNGTAIEHKAGAPIRLLLRPAPDQERAPALRVTAYETLGDRRYPVLESTEKGALAWPALGLPAASHGPVEIVAEGYLVVADYRDEGACCDSRAVGWIAPEHIRGEVAFRLAGDPTAAPDLDPAARGFGRVP